MSEHEILSVEGDVEGEFFHYCGCGWCDMDDNSDVEPVIEHIVDLPMNQLCNALHRSGVRCHLRNGHLVDHACSKVRWS